MLIRCSQLGAIMTEPRNKSEELSETCKSALLDMWIEEKYGRKKDLTNKYVQKGLMVEEDSITLYSRATKLLFKKNVDRLKNDYIIGTPDCFVGENINNTSLIIDFKSSWDLFTFQKAKHDKINKSYYWQLMGYMALTGAKQAKLVYCLVDTPDQIINDEKRRLMWKMNVIDENELTDEAFAEIEKNMLFSDIPINERYFEIEIKRNDEDIEKIYNKVIICNKYIETVLK